MLANYTLTDIVRMLEDKLREKTRGLEQELCEQKDACAGFKARVSVLEAQVRGLEDQIRAQKELDKERQAIIAQQRRRIEDLERKEERKDERIAGLEGMLDRKRKLATMLDKHVEEMKTVEDGAVVLRTTPKIGKRSKDEDPLLSLKKTEISIDLDSSPMQVRHHEKSREMSRESLHDKPKDKPREKPNQTLQVSLPVTSVIEQDYFTSDDEKPIPTPIPVSKSPPGLQSKQEPRYKYHEVVRKKDERKKMHGTDCPCCSGFYKAAGMGQDQIQKLSRHRFKHLPPDTPEGYWDVDFPSTQK